jgi:hypothetical protein
MKAVELAESRKLSWRNIAISPTTGSLAQTPVELGAFAMG